MCATILFDFAIENPEKIMPKLKEANSGVGFQLSIPVGFYCIMTYSAPSVTLALTGSKPQVEPADVHITWADGDSQSPIFLRRGRRGRRA